MLQFGKYIYWQMNNRETKYMWYVKQSSDDEGELLEVCGSYCLNALNPLLDRTNELQNKLEAGDTNEKSNILKKLESFESRLNGIEINTQCHNSKALLSKLDSIEGKLEELRPKVSTKNNTAGKFEKIGDKYYYIEHNEKVNWFVAGDICRRMNAHLVSFESEWEFNDVVSRLRSNISYWIDLNDLGEEGQFRSVVTGYRPQFQSWHDDEPNNGRSEEHCGDLWYNKQLHLMNDSTCTYLKSFICEYSNI